MGEVVFLNDYVESFKKIFSTSDFIRSDHSIGNDIEVYFHKDFNSIEIVSIDQFTNETVSVFLPSELAMIMINSIKKQF